MGDADSVAITADMGAMIAQQRRGGTTKRFFRSLKEEYVWLENFADFEQAKAAVAAGADRGTRGLSRRAGAGSGWLGLVGIDSGRFYNSERPRQSLNDLGHEQLMAQQAEQVA